MGTLGLYLELEFKDISMKINMVINEQQSIVQLCVHKPTDFRENK